MALSVEFRSSASISTATTSPRKNWTRPCGRASAASLSSTTSTNWASWTGWPGEHGTIAAIWLRLAPGVQAHTHSHIQTGPGRHEVRLLDRLGRRRGRGGARRWACRAFASPGSTHTSVRRFTSPSRLPSRPGGWWPSRGPDARGLRLRAPRAQPGRRVGRADGRGRSGRAPRRPTSRRSAPPSPSRLPAARPAPAPPGSRAGALPGRAGGRGPVCRRLDQDDPRACAATSRSTGAWPTTSGRRFTAQRMRRSGWCREAGRPVETVTIAGKYCESGDVLIRTSPCQRWNRAT